MTPPENESTLPPSAPASIDDVRREVKVLRRWVVAIGVVAALLAVVACGAVATFATSFWAIGEAMSSPTADEMKTEIDDMLTKAYGADLESSSIESVKAGWDEVPFPYSLIEGDSIGSYAVTYRLRGVAPEFATIIYDPSEISSQGFVPPRSSLTSRLELPRLKALLAAYAEQTGLPVGGVRRYDDEPYEDPSQSTEGSITVSGTEYDPTTLWMVVEGQKPVDGKAPMIEGENLGHVFFLNEATGEFEYVGTEPAFGIGY